MIKKKEYYIRLAPKVNQGEIFISHSFSGVRPVRVGLLSGLFPDLALGLAALPRAESLFAAPPLLDFPLSRKKNCLSNP